MAVTPQTISDMPTPATPATSPRVRHVAGRRHSRRRGLSIVLVVLTLVVLIGFVSLAVDVGRVRVAKIQLQTAADAAATAAVSGMELFPTLGVAEPQERAVA